MTWEIRKRNEAILGREVGAVRKEWGGRLRVALLYPNRYRVGMANLGFLTVHARINARPDALCERAFLPDPGEKGTLLRRATPLSTLESGRPLADFDIVAFSLSYENDLLNAPDLLASGGVPPFRSDRVRDGRPLPLVVAGGFAASLNPEPSGVLADAVVVGDGERAVDSILAQGPPMPRDGGYLEALARIPGLYVPSGYLPEYEGPGEERDGPEGALRGIFPRPGFPSAVAREAVGLSDAPPLFPVLAEDTALGGMALVETSRGCPGMCAFCAAAHACPGFREVPLSHALAAADAAWPYRRKIGLVGAAVLEWTHFRGFAREILARGGAVSPASVRADLVDDEIAEILGRSGHRTVTLAPESGSRDLRARLGKRIPDETFFSAAQTLARAGVVSFKLYFLVGVPGAGREEEVAGTVSFLRAFRDAVLRVGRARGRMGVVTAVLSPFVPKPFTPLQWAPLLPEAEIRRRQDGIAAGVRGVANVRVRPEPSRAAVLEAYLGLSDRRVERTLRRAGKGGWPLPRGARGHGDAFVFRERMQDAVFPWDIVDGGLPKRTLRDRYERFRRG